MDVIVLSVHETDTNFLGDTRFYKSNAIFQDMVQFPLSALISQTWCIYYPQKYGGVLLHPRVQGKEFTVDIYVFKYINQALKCFSSRFSARFLL